MTANVKEVIEITQKSLRALNDALYLYNNVLDKIVPWKTYEDAVKQLNLHSDDYSAKSGEIVGEIRSLIMNAQDLYFSATQNIGGWCGLAAKLLKAYLRLLAGNNPETLDSQRKILIKVLGSGITKMEKADINIGECSEKFTSVSRLLFQLNTRFSQEFNSKDQFYNDQIDKIRTEAYAGAVSGIILGPFGLLISYSIAAGVVEGKLVPELNAKLEKVKKYFHELKETIEKTNFTIDDTREKLKDERRKITDLKDAADTTKFFVSMDEMKEIREEVEGSVNDLISLCGKYRERHGMDKTYKFSTIVLL